MNNTVLTDEQINDEARKLYGSLATDQEQRLARAIEQAVLQSAQVQAWKKDAELWQFFIFNYEEYGTVPYIDGENLRTDVDAAMEKKP